MSGVMSGVISGRFLSPDRSGTRAPFDRARGERAAASQQNGADAPAGSAAQLTDGCPRMPSRSHLRREENPGDVVWGKLGESVAHVGKLGQSIKTCLPWPSLRPSPRFDPSVSVSSRAHCRTVPQRWDARQERRPERVPGAQRPAGSAGRPTRPQEPCPSKWRSSTRASISASRRQRDSSSQARPVREGAVAHPQQRRGYRHPFVLRDVSVSCPATGARTQP